MSRGVAVTFASGGGFIGGFMVPALVLSIVGYVTRAPSTSPPTSPVDEILLVVYFVGLYALASAVGYALAAATSRAWRHRAPRRAAGISALVGLVAQLLHWTGAAFVLLLPLMNWLPRSIGLTLGTAMPGIVCGIAVALWSSRRKSDAPVSPPPGP